LTLDDNHFGARQLEADIRQRLAALQAQKVVLDARVELDRGALTAADELLRQARAMIADSPDVRALERDLRAARVEREQARRRAEMLRQTLDSAEVSLERSDLESALAMAREALQLDPASDRARFIEQEASRRLEPDFAVTVLRPPRGSSVPAPERVQPDSADAPTVVRRPKEAPPRAKTTPAARPARAPLSAFVSGFQRQTSSAWTKIVQTLGGLVERTRRLPLSRLVPAALLQPVGSWKYAAAAATALVVAAIAVAVVMRSASVPAPPDSRLVLEALPWATVAAIESADGKAVPLPAQASTPLVVDLPAGSYRVRFVGPAPDLVERVMTVEARAGAPQVVTAAAFDVPTPESYFERYLGGGTGEVVPVVSIEAPPSAPPVEVAR
jgi:hypothetical protein